MNYKFVLLGSGNVATHLALALHAKGFQLLQIYSRSINHARALADRVEAEATDSLAALRKDADIYIISVKDDAVPAMAAALADANPRAIVVHTAGSVPIQALEVRKARYGVLYPMQTFTRSRDIDFSEVPCFIEGSDSETFETIKTIAGKISSRVVEADSARRKTMHLAAVFASNMVNHCYHLAECILSDAGLDFSLLYPLISETARKAQAMSPFDAQTGPMVRYDHTVMDAQMRMLHDEDMKAIYEVMAKSIHERHALSIKY